MEVSGASLFKVLQKRSANPALLARKSEMMGALKALVKEDSARTRHGVSLALQNLTRSSVIGLVTDPDMGHSVVNGKPVSPALRAWAEKNGVLARTALLCVDGAYSAGLTPLALYAGEDVSRLVGDALSRWVSDARNPNASSSPRTLASQEATTSPSEACVDGFSIFTAGAKPMPGAPRAKPINERAFWVGGYQHTLKDMQELSGAEGSATFTPYGEAKMLAQASNYQKLLNHLRTRGDLVGRTPGAIAKAGETFYEVKTAVPEAGGVAANLASLVAFPAAKIEEALENYKASQSNKNYEALKSLIDKNCSEIFSSWRNPKGRATLSESPKQSH
jgi:hypothetical protein